MTEPIEEIVARLERMETYIGYRGQRDNIRALIASWRERGEALKPFARFDIAQRENPDGDLCQPTVTVGCLRRARAALNGEPK